MRLPGATHLVVLRRWKPPETYIPKLRQFLARLRVTVNEDKTRFESPGDSYTRREKRLRKPGAARQVVQRAFSTHRRNRSCAMRPPRAA